MDVEAVAKGEAERTAANGEAVDENAEKEAWGFSGCGCGWDFDSSGRAEPFGVG